METKLGGHCYLSLVTVAHWPVSLAPSHSMLFASCVTAHNISAWCSPARTVVFPCFQPNLLFSWLPTSSASRCKHADAGPTPHSGPISSSDERSNTTLPNYYCGWLIQHQHRKMRRRIHRRQKPPAWVVTLNAPSCWGSSIRVNPRLFRSGRTSVGHLTPCILSNCILTTFSFIFFQTFFCFALNLFFLSGFTKHLVSTHYYFYLPLPPPHLPSHHIPPFPSVTVSTEALWPH